MKKLNIALLIGIIVTLTYFVFENAYNDIGDLQNSVVRLHILANSDSEEDQKLKLMVRDAILKEFSGLLSSSDSIQAQIKILENLDEIESVAADVIVEHGYSYSVAANLERVEFDTRFYGDIAMPAGIYDALRIEIGKAKGKNWWCVIFPSLCLSGSTRLDNADYDEYFSNEEVIILERPKKVNYKFKCFEILSGIGRFFRQ